MSEQEEQTKTTVDNDSTISSADLENIEKEVLAKDKQAQEALKKEVEEKVRKELATEQKLKELEAEKQKLEALVAKQAKEREESEKTKEEELAKLKEQVGTSKAITNHDSPFHDKAEQAGNFADQLDSERIKEIDDESLQAFLDANGLTRKQWAAS